MNQQLTLIIASLVLVAGCQQTRPQPPDRVSDIPLIVDEAMQKRDYEPSTIYYPRGSIVAGPTGYMFEKNSHIPAEVTRVTEPFVAVGNIILLPVTLPLSKPWQAREFHGAQIPPTYTGQPPLE